MKSPESQPVLPGFEGQNHGPDCRDAPLELIVPIYDPNHDPYKAKEERQKEIAERRGQSPDEHVTGAGSGGYWVQPRPGAGDKEQPTDPASHYAELARMYGPEIRKILAKSSSGDN